MIAEGYGGRGDIGRDGLGFLAGLLGLPEDYEPMPQQNCANPKCGRPFRPRAEGDDYCSERCDPLNKFRIGADNSDD